MAVDPSLTCSGWAAFSTDSGRLLAVGKIRSIPSANPLACRLEDLQLKVKEVMEQMDLGKNDVLICEAPTTMRDPRAAFKVEQVRGIFEAVARERKLLVPGRLNPRSVQFEILGLKGRQAVRASVKSAAVQVAARLYGTELGKLGFEARESNLKKHQDIVDAMLIGALALSRIKSALIPRQPLELFFEERRNRRRIRIR